MAGTPTDVVGPYSPSQASSMVQPGTISHTARRASTCATCEGTRLRAVGKGAQGVARGAGSRAPGLRTVTAGGRLANHSRVAEINEEASGARRRGHTAG
eukprot:3693903-Prymnesium_polylepis.1